MKIYHALGDKIMENLKQIYMKKDGESEWKKIGGYRSLTDFNRDFEDWVARYYEGDEQQECQNWEEALEVLNTVGASAMAATFKIEEVK